MVTNPPYGERISTPDLLGLYKVIGQKLKREHSGGEAWILSYREECFDEIGLKPSLKTPLYNGSLECELRKYVLFSGRLDEHRAAGGTVKTDAERRQMSEKRRFKKHRDDFKRGFDDDGSREKHEDNHRFNKFSKSEDFKGRKGGFGKREGGGGKRDGGFGKKGHDFRAKGNDRAARQEARKRFFNSDDQHEED